MIDKMKKNGIRTTGLMIVLALILFQSNTNAQAKVNPDSSPAAPLDTSLVNSLEYRLIGPWRGGRSAAVTGVPGRDKLYYFGSTGGGLWRTRDAGQSWENISDGYFGGSVGAVAVAPSDHNVMYVGGGEKTVRGNVSYGYGIWKSTDEGATWTASGLLSSRHIPRICVHPTNHDIVFAAVLGDLYKDTPDRGVYKSTDGGQNWKRVLHANERAGAVDLIIDPSNPRILYATTWRVHRNPYELSSGGEGSALWKSTDMGETWTNISESKGLPTGTWGIVGVTISPVNPQRVWAIIENEKGGVYRSDNGGKTWTLLNDDRSLRQRAWYYTRIYADTEDEDVVYVLNVSYHKSKDGGKTFTSANAPHGDHHDLWIAPDNNQRMIMGDDGGAQVTLDGGENWSTYHNQPTAQFYRVTTDNHFPFRIYAAQQDNSTVRISHRSADGGIGERDWEPTAGCECGHIAPDPRDPEIVFGGCYDGFIERLDHRTNYSQMVHVWPDNPMGHGAASMKYRFQWNFPLFFSRHEENALYTASNHLHKSLDGGQSWTVISPDLTRNDSSKLGPSGGPITKDNTSVEYYCTIFAADESPRLPDVLWAGSDDGLVHVTLDGGRRWNNVTPPDFPEWIQVNSLEPDPHIDGGCYLAATMYKSGDYRPYLYRTTDYGKTWTKIIKGISENHFTRVIRSHPEIERFLFAGTESGVYFSTDDGSQWHPLQLNLPIVPVTDLTIKEDKLIVATQGRSLWILDDLRVLHELAGSGKPKSSQLFGIAPAYRMNGSQNNGEGEGKNPATGPVIRFYLPEVDEKDSISLVFTDMLGDTISRYDSFASEDNLKLKAEKGMNAFVWNMRYPPAEKFEGIVLWWSSLAGPKVSPGTFFSHLIKDDDTLTAQFEILKDPRSGMSEEDYRTLFNFEKEVWQKVTEAHKAIKEIRDVRKQLNHFSSRLQDQKEIVRATNEIDSLMTRIEENLYQTKNRSNQDPLNFPIRATNKLVHLNALYAGREYPPTKQAVEVKDMLVIEIDGELEKWREIKEVEIPAFNNLMQDSAIPSVILER